MRVWIYVLLGLGAASGIFSENLDWDVAVTVGDQIEFLNENASLIGLAHHGFNNLKALTYDDIRHQFIVSDMNEENDTLYKIKLSDTNNIIPVIKDLKDDVVDMAVDPVDDILYWVDSFQKKIMKISLNDSEAKPEILFEFKDEIPQGLAVDSCRRKIYWANINEHHSAKIERANLDGSEREIVIEGNLSKPTGIVIDQASRKFFWTDLGEGIYFRIESAKLDGSNRRILYEDTHQQPYRIAINEKYIFWSDLTNYAIWGLKNDETGLKPEILRQFNDKPRGLITRNHDFKNMPECREVLDALNKEANSEEDIIPAEDSLYCLNYGELTSFGCKCNRGFTGPRCEIKLCHNLCLTGSCYLSSQGYPKCKCPEGFTGDRCEIEVCKNFCLNNGTCDLSSRGLGNKSWAKCQCPEGYKGVRCEKKLEQDIECTCEDGVIVKSNNGVCSCPSKTIAADPQITCSCEDGIIITPLNGGKPFCSCSSSTSPPEDYLSALQQPDIHSFTNRIQEPLVMTFIFISTLLFLLTCVLSLVICKQCNRRPRIKKRIIVNKNVTPMTCRPNPPTEQCEITIEDCCNMNICETPCFEPKSFAGFQRSKKTEEKKTLLTSMENGEDIY